MIYKYLVASALQEELEEFLKLFEVKLERLELGVGKLKFQHEGKQMEILTFSCGKMGMPFTAAKLMQIIQHFNPQITLFIGTCASLKKDHPLGSVLVPHVVFTYESGKYEDGTFYPDYYSFHTDDDLRKESENLKSHQKFKYSAITDEDFCSGAAVIDDSKKIEEINKGGRKVSGLDMEAYSIACINQILRSKNQLLVIKGISDYAKKKGETELNGNKQLAKENSAHFALSLIKHLEDVRYGITVFKPISITTRIVENLEANLKLKVMFTITNNSADPVIFHSMSFICDDGVQIDSNASASHQKPMIKIGEEKITESIKKDIYSDIYIIPPKKSTISCWVPINPEIGKATLQQKLKSSQIGTWELRYIVSSENSPQVLDLREKISSRF